MWSRAPSRLRHLLRQPTCTYQDLSRGRGHRIPAICHFRRGADSKDELCIRMAEARWGVRRPPKSVPIGMLLPGSQRAPSPARRASDEQATAGRDRHSVYVSAGSLALLPPLEEFLVEVTRIGALRLIGVLCSPPAKLRRRPGRWTCRRWLGAGVGRARRRLLATVEPCLRCFEACPAREAGRDVDVAPFRMMRRPLEVRDPRKERLHEPLYPPV